MYFVLQDINLLGHLDMLFGQDDTRLTSFNLPEGNFESGVTQCCRVNFIILSINQMIEYLRFPDGGDVRILLYCALEPFSIVSSGLGYICRLLAVSLPSNYLGFFVRSHRCLVASGIATVFHVMRTDTDLVPVMLCERPVGARYAALGSLNIAFA